MKKSKPKKEGGDFKEILFSQFISNGGGLIAGTLLAIWTDKILLIPGMFILLPGFLELRGNISGTLAARISSGLFVGLIKRKSVKRNNIIKENFFAAFFLAMTISAVLGLVAFLFTGLFFGAYLPNIILIPIIAGLFANLIEIPLTIFFTLYLFKKGRDPDNIMGPFVSTTGDIISVLSLLAAILII